MPAMDTGDPVCRSKSQPSILLASDSTRLGSSLHKTLREEGFEVEFAGDYSGVDSHLRRRNFDMVLLEVTGEYAAEIAVQTALRIKRSNASQLVGYIADAALAASGLAGDGIFPRSTARLPDALRDWFAEEDTQKR